MVYCRLSHLYTHTAAILVDVSYCLVDGNRLTQEHNQGVDTTNLFPQYIVAAATATALVVVVVVVVVVLYLTG